MIEFRENGFKAILLERGVLLSDPPVIYSGTPLRDHPLR